MCVRRCGQAAVHSVGNYAMKSEFLKDLKSSVRNPAWLCFLWVGMTAGISFIGVPAVFTADLLSRPEALDAASAIFGALNRAELFALVLLLVLVRLSGQAKPMWVFIGVLTLIQLAQSAWLLPELAERSQQIASGNEPAPSMAHALYSVLELMKVVLLLTLGFRALHSRNGAPVHQKQ